MHTIVHILQQSAVTGRDGVSVRRKWKKGKKCSLQNTRTGVQVKGAPTIKGHSLTREKKVIGEIGKHYRTIQDGAPSLQAFQGLVSVRW